MVLISNEKLIFVVLTCFVYEIYTDMCPNDGKFPVATHCDSYIECINGTAYQRTCPDGLFFNENTNSCVFKNEVDCGSRTGVQPAQPTENCPHQFGYFKVGDTKNCGQFIKCEEGIESDIISCPNDLAFNSDTYQCDWPDLVEDCDAEAFLNFKKCSDIPASEIQQRQNCMYPADDPNNQKFYVCVLNKEGTKLQPRLLSCGANMVFDASKNKCIPIKKENV